MPRRVHFVPHRGNTLGSGPTRKTIAMTARILTRSLHSVDRHPRGSATLPGRLAGAASISSIDDVDESDNPLHASALPVTPMERYRTDCWQRFAV